MTNRKAQIKFGETIGVIIIVYIILMTGFIWYNNINDKKIREIYDEDQRSQAFEKYYYVVNLNLLRKAENGYIDEEFDINSIRAFRHFANSTEGEDYLRQKLGFATIQVKILDPKFRINETILLYNKTLNAEEFDLEKFTSLIPVYDKMNSKTHIGVLEVSAYIEKI